MNSEDFAKKSTQDKWQHIYHEMAMISQAETAFSMRRHLNPHHPIDQQRQEALAFRLEQYTKWCKVKDLYAEFRDELSNTFENKGWASSKDILERIFTNEVDDALRSTLEE